MKVSITFIQTLLISITLVSCASRAPSKNMLDKKSNYLEMETPKLIGVDQELTRSEAKDVEIYVYPKELPSGDYFEGGYIRAIVEGESWQFRKHRKKKSKKKRKRKTTYKRTRSKKRMKPSVYARKPQKNKLSAKRS